MPLAPVSPIRSLVAPPARPVRRHSRHAFTLIELLVAISILMILAAMTFSLVNASIKGDQIRTAARQIQSYVEGARDRAIHAGKINPGADSAAAHRGVRFLRDPNFLPPNFTDTADPRYGRIVNAMVFVQAQEPERGVTTIDTTDNQWFPWPSPAGWDELVEKGLLNPNGASITLATSPTASPFNFVMRRVDWMHPTMGLVPRWRLTRPVTRAFSYSGASLSAVLYLEPAVMPNQEPRLLPASIQIDLSNSRSPWGPLENLDLMFSPRGTVSGSLSAAGNIHLLLADSRDIERRLGPIDVDLDSSGGPLSENEKHLGETLVVSITTQTGKVTSHPVSYATNDPFQFAETGEEAR